VWRLQPKRLRAQLTLGAPSSRIRRFVRPPKILDEGGHIAIAGCHAGQPLGIFERARDIPPRAPPGKTWL